MGKWFQPMWTAPRKKGRHSFLRTECVPSSLPRGPAACVFIAHFIERALICMPGSTAAKLGQFILNRSPSRGTTIRKFFWYSKSLNRLLARAVTWRRISLAPATKVKELEVAGESAMKASLAKGMPHGYEVGYRYFTINGRMFGHGDPVRVKQGQRVLFSRFER